MAELVVFQTGSRLYSLRRVRSLAVMLMSLTDEREFVADKWFPLRQNSACSTEVVTWCSENVHNCLDHWLLLLLMMMMMITCWWWDENESHDDNQTPVVGGVYTTNCCVLLCHCSLHVAYAELIINDYCPAGPASSCTITVYVNSNHVLLCLSSFSLPYCASISTHHTVVMHAWCTVVAGQFHCMQ